ncbi:MAG: response regulator [Bacteroidia bacterium]|nr:response regulator [Bacteroidia bacterium]MCZ2276856.1 response regulator [Bacteroidia bacterium]
MSKSPVIYIVEDDSMQRELLADHLGKMSGYRIKTFETGEQCLSYLAENTEVPVAIYLDYYLNSIVQDAMDGLDVLTEIKKKHPDCEVVMLSGQDKIEVAVDTMKYGAFDYIVKGESAFYRAEKALYNIYRFARLQKNANLYKTLTITFGISLLLLVILLIILQQAGLISNMPGWS